MHIAITTTTFAKIDTAPLQVLTQHGLQYKCNPHGRTLSAQEVPALLENCVGVIAGTEPLTADVLKLCPKLKVISRLGVGLDNVDTIFAEQQGIIVKTTSAKALGQAVAEYTLALTLNLLRHVSIHDHTIRQNLWQKHMGSLLQGKKVGIIGLGRMGSAVAELFSVLGCSIAFTDPKVITTAYTKMPLQDLLAWADIVTLHCPAQAAPLLGKEMLSCMRQGTWLINTARGTLIDEEALYDSIVSQHLAGAALDVFSQEPYTGKLSELSQVLLSTHAASYARESRTLMEMEAVENLCQALKI